MLRFNDKIKIYSFGFAPGALGNLPVASVAGAQITVKALDHFFPVKGFFYLSSLLSVSTAPLSSDKLGCLRIYSAKSTILNFITFLYGLIFLGLKTGSKIQQDWKLSWIGLATTFPK